MQPKVGLTVIFNAFEVGADQAPAIHAQARAALADMGCAVVDGGLLGASRDVPAAAARFRAEGAEVIALVSATWSDDDRLIDLVERVDLPVLAWSLPGVNTGSLCVGMQFGTVLFELGKPYRYVFGPLDDPQTRREAQVYLRAAALKARLRHLVVGQIGSRVPGMTEVSFDEFELKRLIGPRVIHQSIDWLKDRVAAVADAEVQAGWDLVRALGARQDVADKEIEQALRYHAAMRDWAREESLGALAVECYPALMGRVCLGYALLAGDGLAGACEGDVNSAVAMYMLGQLTGGPVHNTDPLDVDPDANTLMGSHCGSTHPSLCAPGEQPVLAPVRLADQGVCLTFTARPGPATLVNLVGRRETYRMGIAAGTAVATTMEFPGNPFKVRLNAPVGRFLREATDLGLGHHWMGGYGQVAPELEAWAGLCGVRSLSL